jgi:hypothetical protein
MLISEPQSGLLELFGEVLIELVHAFEFGLKVGISGNDLYII